MSSDKVNTSGAPVPNVITQQAGASQTQATYADATPQHAQQVLAAFAQGTPQIDAAQLLMNPHTAAMVATVAAAAQQLARPQAFSLPQFQVIQAPVSAHTQPPKPSTPPPQSSMAGLPQLGLPPHIATMLGISAAPQVYQHSAGAASGVSSSLLSNMPHWKLGQLETHVRVLRETNQPIPQPVALMLADARRKEEKRTAKRVANRKSACTSRARKKALVEEMTKTNARLRRQALILSLLPDLVIAITTEGEITFCSARVEHVLRYNIDDLIGSNLADLLIPASKKALAELIEELVVAERTASRNEQAEGEDAAAPAVGAASEQIESKQDSGGNRNGFLQSSSGSSNGAAVVSDQSFPLSVVKVQSKHSGAEENSDLSTSNNGKTTPAPANGSTSAPRSVNSSLGNGEDSSGTQPPKGRGARKQTSSDDSFSSSSDAKNLQKANENLNRNVRWHNEKMLSKNKAGVAGSKHKDDVTGEDVTPNNAGARLSSLQHLPSAKKKSNKLDSLEESSSSSDDLLAGVEEKKKRGKNGNGSSSDESGYRESNESAREDTSSSASDMSSGGRQKPMAPTCDICLIKDDLTTIWCEVTSSIRTRLLKEEEADTSLPTLPARGSKSSKTNSSDDGSDPRIMEEVKELLLCLRPIRDGEEKVDESLRWLPPKKIQDSDVLLTSTTSENNTGDESPATKRGPMKKRQLLEQESSDSGRMVSESTGSEDVEPPQKKQKTPAQDDPEQSVAESLMLMGGYEQGEPRESD